MPLFITINLAIKALLSNKNRALLTMLGIIIGISSVIIIISAGQGAKSVIMGEMESFGTNYITANPGKIGMPGTASGIFKMKYYTSSLKPGTFKYISYSFPVVSYSGFASYKQNIESGLVIGTIPQGLEAFSFELDKGRLFTTFDEKKSAPIAVLDGNLAEKLFGNEDPIGKSIKLAKQNWTIIGTTKSKGGLTGQFSYIFIPINVVVNKLVNTDSLDEWDFVVNDKNYMNEAKEEVRQFLRKQLDLKPEDDDNFRLETAVDALATMNSVFDYMTIFLTLIASISLLVGGIGIMNIMLVSVTERTKEIGLRKAIGAKYKDILKQFLIEAVVLTLIGGVIGMILGSLGSVLVAKIGNWPPDVPLFAIITSVGICAGTGIIFGYYPARKAALLDPITALRTE